MSKNSTKASDIITPVILEMLFAFEAVLKQFGVDFYLVGAVARDIQLSENTAFAPSRKTKDIDITLLVAAPEQFYQIKAGLINTGLLAEHPSEAIKLYYREELEVDLLPLGDIENELRETRLEKPRLFAMDVPGFKEIFSSCGITGCRPRPPTESLHPRGYCPVKDHCQ